MSELHVGVLNNVIVLLFVDESATEVPVFSSILHHPISPDSSVKDAGTPLLYIAATCDGVFVTLNKEASSIFPWKNELLA